MEKDEAMQDLMAFIAKAPVDNPEQVAVMEAGRDHTSLRELIISR